MLPSSNSSHPSLASLVLSLLDYQSIESYLYRLDPFRATSVPYPLPYPLKFLPVQHGFANKVRERRWQIQSILQQCGLPSEFQIFVARLFKPEYPHDDQPRLTVQVRYQGPASHTFEQAKHGLAGLPFNVDGIPMDIEIIHPEYCFRPSLFPIPAEHASVKVYEKLREAFVEKLCATIPSQWTMASLFLVGPLLEQSSPAIVIMVRPGSLYNWTDLASSIRCLIEQYKSPHPSMDVMFIIPGDTTSSARPKECTLSRMDQSHLMRPDDSLRLGSKRNTNSIRSALPNANLKVRLCRACLGYLVAYFVQVGGDSGMSVSTIGFLLSSARNLARPSNQIQCPISTPETKQICMIAGLDGRDW